VSDDKQRILWIVMVGTMVGMALALNALPLPFLRMPQGGNVTLAMVPLAVLAVLYGPMSGALGGLVYGLLRIPVDAWAGNLFIVHPVQVILDYQLPPILFGAAVGAIAVSRRALPVLAGVAAGSLLRFTSHVISGAVFFGEYAPAGQNVWAYSLAYNLTYVLPEAVLIAVASLLLVTSGLDRVFSRGRPVAG